MHITHLFEHVNYNFSHIDRRFKASRKDRHRNLHTFRRIAEKISRKFRALYSGTEIGLCWCRLEPVEWIPSMRSAKYVFEDTAVFYDRTIHTMCKMSHRISLLFFSVARRNKVIGSRYGLLCRDVAFLPREALRQSHDEFSKSSPTFCIEIKPKQGFVLDETAKPVFDDIQKCRFCYLQVKFSFNFQRLKLCSP